MSLFNVSLLAEISVSGSLSILASSKEAAEIEARRLHMRAQVYWTYQNQQIGAYVGPLNSVWAIGSEVGSFQVSLTSRIHISAYTQNVSAYNEQEAISKIENIHSQGKLIWSFGEVKLVQYTGPILNVWVTPII